MRRAEKEIKDKSGVEAVIRRARVCRLGMCDGGRPYVVPLCFGYEDGALYIHSATEGTKIGILRKNPSVCAEFDVDAEVLPAPAACGWGMAYKSVIAFGEASFVEDAAEKQKALGIIMRQYGEEKDYQFSEKAQRVVIIKVRITSMTGKQALK